MILLWIYLSGSLKMSDADGNDAFIQGASQLLSKCKDLHHPVALQCVKEVIIREVNSSVDIINHHGGTISRREVPLEQAVAILAEHRHQTHHDHLRHPEHRPSRQVTVRMLDPAVGDMVAAVMAATMEVVEVVVEAHTVGAPTVMAAVEAAGVMVVAVRHLPETMEHQHLRHLLEAMVDPLTVGEELHTVEVVVRKRDHTRHHLRVRLRLQNIQEVLGRMVVPLGRGPDHTAVEVAMAAAVIVDDSMVVELRHALGVPPATGWMCECARR